MSETSTSGKICVIIGASHAGVNCAFHLRNEGWEGEILLYDADPTLPYHRPPLSKAYLTHEEEGGRSQLRSAESYERKNIGLKLGLKVKAIQRDPRTITLEDGSEQTYDKLILATGARPLVPPIKGLDEAKHLYFMRTAEDALRIRQRIRTCARKRVVVIGGGYIGLEAAASLRKIGADVTVLERESRVLARVAAPATSDYFERLHASHGVDIFTGKQVDAIETAANHDELICTDGSRFEADMIVIGVGIRVNTELAASIGIEIENGIRVDASTRTSDEDIFAIGDCTYHHNPHYDRYVRLESVQNAADQAKVCAAAVCGKEAQYNALPWFWSDQYGVKLQMVGLSTDYDEVHVRKEEGEAERLSVWYFAGDRLLAVDAINFPKAYVMGTKLIKSNQRISKKNLVDGSMEFSMENLAEN
ncbi:MAG: NAD(P)/FAD-dependent oxidoreductase [Bacteroidia bacterium]